MLWWALAALFAWLALREVYYGLVAKPGFIAPQTISLAYVAVTAGLAVAFAWPPLRTLQFERFLSLRARQLAESPQVTVHCNTYFDTAFDPMQLAPGHADPRTGEIVFQQGWCGVLRAHLRHPERMDAKGVFSVQMFVHESMHARGEMNEAITECQAIQRHYHGARLLGIPAEFARKGGQLFYETQYKARRRIGGMQAPYYSDQCAPGKQLDEHLPESTWNSALGSQASP